MYVTSELFKGENFDLYFVLCQFPFKNDCNHNLDSIHNPASAPPHSVQYKLYRHRGVILIMEPAENESIGSFG